MATCYRHPNRETNVSCASCGRPICTDCMTVTPVGMRCPECSRQRTRVTSGVGAAGGSEYPVTIGLIVACVAAFVGIVATGGGVGGRGIGSTLIQEGGLYGPLVSSEPYRIVTSAFLHAGVFHLGLNMLVLWILGRLLEPAIGSLRFAGIFAVSVLAGSFGALLLDPDVVTVGASGGVFGLMAATFLIARERGMDQLAQQIGLLVALNLVFTFAIPQISIGGHLGGLIGGGLAALLVARLERMRVANAGVLEAIAFTGLGVAAVVGALAAAGSA
ncbi:MAG TPA: rhomboid family intramembrane serine protease [Solirubrobacterales bacterium]|nr:rhomboid family intramembrane serine protease [Solirubrobacterales bacterium]